MSEKRSPLIPCDEAVRRLWDYLDDSVPPADRAQVEDHLAFCRRCCGELEFVEHLRGLLASQSASELPPAMIRRLEAFVEEL